MRNASLSASMPATAATAGRDQCAVGRACGRPASAWWLKGGDPFVFGHGGEELQWRCVRASATKWCPSPPLIACAAYAGIPLTHQETCNRCASSLRTVEDDIDAGSGLAAVGRPGFHMGGWLGSYPRAADRARIVATPFALVENGSRPTNAWWPACRPTCPRSRAFAPGTRTGTAGGRRCRRLREQPCTGSVASR